MGHGTVRLREEDSRSEADTHTEVYSVTPSKDIDWSSGEMGANRTDVKHIMTLATYNGHRRPLEYSKDEYIFQG